MTKVVDLFVKPKSESHRYEGQRYTCAFDPHESDSSRWVYRVYLTRVYEIIGKAPTLQAANNAARKEVRQFNAGVEGGRF